MGLHVVRTRRASFSSPPRVAPFLAILAASLLVLAGCEADVLPPGGEPDDAGLVAAVGPDLGPGTHDSEGLLTRIHVKTDPSDPNECGVIYDVYDENGPVTTVLRVREADGGLRPAVVDDLTVGVEVRVWHTGDIAESCPAQGVATMVEIVEG